MVTRDEEKEASTATEARGARSIDEGEGASHDEDVKADASGDESEDEGEDEEEAGDLEEDEAEALKRDLGTDVREGKRRRGETELESASKGEDAGSHPSSTSADTWKAMQTEKAAGRSEAAEETVRVIRTYRFAGEEVREEKDLPVSHPDAKAFLAAEAKKKGQAEANIPGQNRPATSSTAARSVPAAGPRKRKLGGLAAMSAAVTSKPAKINTLEKSKVDWTNFKDTRLGEAEKHQLDAQTKGGSSGLGSMKGYMERRNFLERVQDRLDGPGGPK